MEGWMQEQMLSEKDRADIDKEMRMLWFLWAGNIDFNGGKQRCAGIFQGTDVIR